MGVQGAAAEEVAHYKKERKRKQKREDMKERKRKEREEQPKMHKTQKTTEVEVSEPIKDLTTGVRPINFLEDDIEGR